ncbi:4513_t:CDS:2 [Funneliformis mosseae]|uniref:4513_t:CDS:1 n=1 Tax=Funneliformis mosseae TaxID=27381 RepID=A0A9N8YTK2_FUNMO|nr:4513_t:CDS:2 [Funneliformis mosseae]
MKGLKLVKPKLITGNLVTYDNFQNDELYHFILIYNIKVKKIITNGELFPKEIMMPIELE